MAHPLDDAQAKLDRARTHFTDLQRQAASVGSDPDRHRMFVEYDADEAQYVIYSRFGDTPTPPLSLILGDLIHSARGALDFTAWQLATKHLDREPTEKEAKNIQFPITFSVPRFHSQRVLRFVSTTMAREMLRHQPHAGSDDHSYKLAVLHWISNRDKHRLVLPTFTLLRPPLMPKYSFDPKPPAGTIYTITPLGVWGQAVPYKGDPSTVRFGTLSLKPHPPNTNVEINPEPTLDVAFRHPGNYLSVPEVEALLDHVEYVVGCFERFF